MNVLDLVLKNKTNQRIVNAYVDDYTLSDHTEKRYFESDREIQYAVFGELTSGGRVNRQNIETAIRNLSNRALLWENPRYASFRDDMDEEDAFIENPITVEEGVLECFKCGGKKTISYQKQTRSADEGATTFAKCVTCGNSWRHNN